MAFPVTTGRIIGVGKCDPSCHEPDYGSERSLFNGYTQEIVQAGRDPGEIPPLRARRWAR